MAMQNFVLAALLAGFAVGCASIPMDPEAFRTDAKKDQHVESATLANISIDTATKRLYAFASKCLNMKTVAVMEGIPISGNGQSDVSKFTPKFAANAKQASLTLQYIVTQSNVVTVGKIPADGIYVATIDLEKVDQGSTFTAYYVDQTAYRFKNVATRGLEWVTDEKHLCPDLKSGHLMKFLNRTLATALAFASLSACSTLKTYHHDGDANFKVTFKSTNPNVGKNHISVSIYDYTVDRCGEYLGTIGLDGNQAQEISLPVNHTVGVQTFLETGLFQSTVKTDSEPTLFKAEDGVDFSLVAEREENDFGKTFTVTRGEVSAPLRAIDPPPNCDH